MPGAGARADLTWPESALGPLGLPEPLKKSFGTATLIVTTKSLNFQRFTRGTGSY